MARTSVIWRPGSRAQDGPGGRFLPDGRLWRAREAIGALVVAWLAFKCGRYQTKASIPRHPPSARHTDLEAGIPAEIGSSRKVATRHHAAH